MIDMGRITCSKMANGVFIHREGDLIEKGNISNFVVLIKLLVLSAAM